MSFSKAPYLKQLFHPKSADSLAGWSGFFASMDDKLQTQARVGFEEFLKGQGLQYFDRNTLTTQLNEALFRIEQKVQAASGLLDFTRVQTLEGVFQLAQKYLKPFKGHFLKSETARTLLGQNIPKALIAERGQAAYAELLKTDPLFCLAIGRYSEPASWNQKHLELLMGLTKEDFEEREIKCHVVSHAQFPQTAESILQRKCFNTHDKLVGSHIIATLPESFNLNEKAPVLRTVTKIMHYQRELELFNQAFQKILTDFPSLIGPKIQSILRHHQYEADSILFNTHDVLEGAANAYIDQQIFSLANDFSDLMPWARAHAVGIWDKDTFVSLSLWRVTSWFLNGHQEHSLKMHRDAVLFQLLTEKFGTAKVETGIIDSLLDEDSDVLASIKRREYIDSFSAEFQNQTYPEAVLFHHIDADGLTGGHIVLKALQKKGAQVHSYPLEMFFTDKISEALKKHPGVPAFIVDLGSELSDQLEVPNETPKVFIIDHHRLGPKSQSPSLKIFNPRSIDLAKNMDEGCSAINAFYFSNAYLGTPDNAVSALAGAVGDGMLKRNGTFKGLDWVPYAHAIEQRKVEPVHDKRLALKYRDGTIDMQSFVENCLNPAGSVGYQTFGVELAFNFLDQSVALDDPRLEELNRLKEEKYAQAFSFLKDKNYALHPDFIAFNIQERLDPLSLKEIGNFLEYLLQHPQRAGLSSLSDKYLFGAQKVPHVDQIKVSMRAGPKMIQAALQKRKPTFVDIVKCFPNEPGGIHPFSAAVLIPEKEFEASIKEISHFIQKWN